jgi:hypothetical protein
MSIDKYGEWWFCATEEEGYYVAGSGDKELTNLITRQQAQLIASAPYLLEALKDMLNAENSYPYGGMSESEIAAIEKAHAAIARAEE